MKDTMFQRYGGLPLVTELVMAFYDRVLASERLAPYFAAVDMRRLVEHQAKFVSSVMGGPASYSNAELRDIHAHLEIDGRTFDEMIRLFEESLVELRFAPEDREEILADFRARRAYIVTQVPA
ncbi:group I truncated hemoglobin [Faunimonas sp. B44]|uniref:group I truncated hemoglobin n=1 Tax=Faunimonas sp. B44 TaxID=3461493 RepID=UPI004043A64D